MKLLQFFHRKKKRKTQQLEKINETNLGPCVCVKFPFHLFT
jgi:hypothetical protein